MNGNVEIDPNESLVDKARRLQRESARPLDFDAALYAEVELACAFYKETIYGTTLALAVGGGMKSSQSGAWAAGKMMQGIRRGYITIEMVKVEDVRQLR